MTASLEPSLRRTSTSLQDDRAFIEVQFPVSKLSKESFKERKSGGAQTLTALGKWWGRKPLVLVRAAILGLLLPASEDPTADRDIFLALMTMDEDGLVQRRKGAIPPKIVFEYLLPRERTQAFLVEDGKPKWNLELTRDERQRLQLLAFHRMGYDEKLRYCRRPEDIGGPTKESWARINSHLSR